MTLSPSQLMAHRGHRDQFPENSLLAIKDAIAAGAIHIEFDVQITADGVPILYHDQNMQRISDVDKQITDINASELSRYTARETDRFDSGFIDNPIGLLSELLPIIQQHSDIQFYLELKEESIEVFGSDTCFAALKELFQTFPENLWLISFDLPAVAQAKTEGFTKTALVFRDWDNRDNLLQKAQADAGVTNYKRIPETEAITASKPIVVYEVADIDTAQSLLERGATIVETFCIRKLLGNS